MGEVICSSRLLFPQSVVPPPPPLPPPPELIDPSEVRPFMDPYGRAKTVRIGKWRWPPPKDDNSQDTSFRQFKLKNQQRKHSQVSGCCLVISAARSCAFTPLPFRMCSKELGDGEVGIEWEEYEVSEEQSLPALNPSQPSVTRHGQNEVHRSSYK